MEKDHLIFLSYSTPDRDAVLAFYEQLDRQGYNVWMDRHRLVGGQKWDLEIKRALAKSTIIVVFLSHNSVDRRGYAQREIKLALEQAETRLADDIYLIPVLIDDDVPIPEQLSQIQVIGGADVDKVAALTGAIDHQLSRLGAESVKAQIDSNVRWSFSTFKDTIEALPGYDARYRLIHLSSKEYPRAGEITDIIRGDLQREVVDCRKVLFDQDADFLNFGQDRYRRQNSWEADCGDPHIVGRMLSVTYSIYFNFAGAAHPNSGFRTYNFSLNPLIEFRSPRELFADEDAALNFIAEECRKQLLNEKFDGMIEGETLSLPDDDVISGTTDWEHFDHFAFLPQSIVFLFPPYQVAPYAMGPQMASISYEDVAPFLRTEVAALLDVEYLKTVGKPWPFPAVDDAKIAAEPSNDQDAA